MGAEIMDLYLFQGGPLDERIGRGRAKLTELLCSKLLDGGGQLYKELMELELAMSGWQNCARNQRLELEAAREETDYLLSGPMTPERAPPKQKKPPLPKWMHRMWRRGV